MYRVLLPVDERKPRARAQAEFVRELPAGDDLAVDVVHVHSDVSAADAEWAAGGGFSETFAEEMASLRKADRIPSSVETVVEILESAGIDYTVHETTGEPPEAILEAAEEFDSDVIVLGLRSRSPVGKVLFGSVAQAVILASDRPVAVAPVSSESE